MSYRNRRVTDMVVVLDAEQAVEVEAVAAVAVVVSVTMASLAV